MRWLDQESQLRWRGTTTAGCCDGEAGASRRGEPGAGCRQGIGSSGSYREVVKGRDSILRGGAERSRKANPAVDRKRNWIGCIRDHIAAAILHHHLNGRRDRGLG